MLRRSRDLSQEELAEMCGVSRQAVSKWESEQSLPEIEKMMALSDVFGVSTDYILKGIEPLSELPVRKKRPAKPYDIVGTALIFLGVIIGGFISAVDRTGGPTGHLFSALVAFVMIVIGLTVFGLGQVRLTKREQKRNALEFTRANVWAVAFLACSLLYNAAVAHAVSAFPLTLTNERVIFGYSETVAVRPEQPDEPISEHNGAEAPPVTVASDPELPELDVDMGYTPIKYKTVYHESFYSTLPDWLKLTAGAAFVIVYVLVCSSATLWATVEIERERKASPPAEIKD